MFLPFLCFDLYFRFKEFLEAVQSEILQLQSVSFCSGIVLLHKFNFQDRLYLIFLYFFNNNKCHCKLVYPVV